MVNLRHLIAFFALMATFFSTPVLAVAGFPLSLGVDGGVTEVKYKGKSETGYFWVINGNYKLNDFSSIYSGYGETSADFPDINGLDQKFTSASIPLALQVNVPFILGNVYVRGGGNYYKNTHGIEKEDGWGLLGTVGLYLSSGFGPGVSLELTYQDRGDAKTSSVAVGAKFGM